MSIQRKANKQAQTSNLWRNSNYVLLWSGQFVSSFGTQISVFAVPLLVLALTHSPIDAGLLGVLGTLPALLSLPSGALVDRWDRKKIMIICDIGRAIALGCIPITLLIWHVNMFILSSIAIIEGIFTTFFTLAQLASLPRIVSKEQLQSAVAQNQSVVASSQLLGPLLGGVCYGLGKSVPFLIDAISYALSAFFLSWLSIPQQEEQRTAPRQKLGTEIIAGVVWLWRNSTLRMLTLITWALLTPSFGYTLILILLAQRLQASPFLIGVILASGGIGNIFGTVLANYLAKKEKTGRILIWMIWLWVLSWLPLAVAPNLLALGIANVFGYTVASIYLVIQSSCQLALVPDQFQGRINSIVRLIVMGSRPLGIGLTGILLEAINPVSTVLVLFIPQLLLAIVVTFYPSIYKLRLREQIATSEEEGREKTVQEES